MRKVSLLMAGAAMGAAAATLATSGRIGSVSPAWAAAADTYRSLNLFGDVFEKVRSDYVEKPTDQKLVESGRMAARALTTFMFRGARWFHFSRLTGTFKVG